MRKFSEYLDRKKWEYGGRFDVSELPAKFIPFFENQHRIEVAFKDSKGKTYEKKWGTVGITTGWKPAFLLMRTRRSRSSPYLLSARDEILRFKV